MRPILLGVGRHHIEDVAHSLWCGGDDVEIPLVESGIVFVDLKLEFAAQVHLGDLVDRVYGRGTLDARKDPPHLRDHALGALWRVVGILTLVPRTPEIHAIFGEEVELRIDPGLGDRVDWGVGTGLVGLICISHLPSLEQSIPSMNGGTTPHRMLAPDQH